MNASILSLLSTADGALGLLLQAAVTEITGKIITSAGSDKAVQLARANLILAIAQANQAILSGQSSGIAALQTGFNNLTSLTKDPANAIVFNTLLAALSNEFEARVQSGLLGKVASILPNEILGWVVTTCQAYVTALTPAPSAA